MSDFVSFSLLLRGMYFFVYHRGLHGLGTRPIVLLLDFDTDLFKHRQLLLHMELAVQSMHLLSDIFL